LVYINKVYGRFELFFPRLVVGMDSNLACIAGNGRWLFCSDVEWSFPRPAVGIVGNPACIARNGQQ
jgi:hypothetical protein